MECGAVEKEEVTHYKIQKCVNKLTRFVGQIGVGDWRCEGHDVSQNSEFLQKNYFQN
jgi:hypothetical protein